MDISSSRHLQHPGVSLQLKRHLTYLHSDLSWLLCGMSDPDTLCLASTVIWSPCPSLQSPFSTTWASHSFPVWDSHWHWLLVCCLLYPGCLLYQIPECCADLEFGAPYSFCLFYLPTLWALFIEYLLYAVLGFRHLRQNNECVNQVPTFNKAYVVMKQKNVQTTQTACNVISSSNSATQKEGQKRKTRC